MTAEASAIDNATQPKVIIRCLVYNHEPYLRDCLEGFVMQKTNFPFKAVVHDDCSTDNSAAIIREYAEKYPDIIEPIYETENQYRKPDGSLTRIMDAATLGRSPYIAYCEGDDYWIDPLKLQKQVDYMDKHPDCTMCFSACKIKKEIERPIPFRGEYIKNGYYTSTDIMNQWIIPTASTFFREDVFRDSRRSQSTGKIIYGDIILFQIAAHRGKVYGMSDAMVTYRVNEGSVLQSEKHQLFSKKKAPEHYRFILKNFPQIDKKIVINRINRAYKNKLTLPNLRPDEKLLILLQMGKYAPWDTFLFILKIIKNCLVRQKKGTEAEREKQ